VRLRKAVRATCATGILAFTWFALSRVQDGAPDAVMYVMAAAVLLVLLYRAVAPARR
jgi:hypothetical protein